MKANPITKSAPFFGAIITVAVLTFTASSASAQCPNDPRYRKPACAPSAAARPAPVVNRTPVPAYRPAAPVVNRTPAPAYRPAPVVNRAPAPVSHPAPVVNRAPAPAYHPAAPIVNRAPAPVSHPAPVVNRTPAAPPIANRPSVPVNRPAAPSIASIGAVPNSLAPSNHLGSGVHKTPQPGMPVRPASPSIASIGTVPNSLAPSNHLGSGVHKTPQPGMPVNRPAAPSIASIGTVPNSLAPSNHLGSGVPIKMQGCTGYPAAPSFSGKGGAGTFTGTPVRKDPGFICGTPLINKSRTPSVGSAPVGPSFSGGKLTAGGSLISIPTRKIVDTWPANGGTKISTKTGSGYPVGPSFNGTGKMGPLGASNAVGGVGTAGIGNRPVGSSGWGVANPGMSRPAGPALVSNTTTNNLTTSNTVTNNTTTVNNATTNINNITRTTVNEVRGGRFLPWAGRRPLPPVGFGPGFGPGFAPVGAPGVIPVFAGGVPVPVPADPIPVIPAVDNPFTTLITGLAGAFIPAAQEQPVDTGAADLAAVYAAAAQAAQDRAAADAAAQAAAQAAQDQAAADLAAAYAAGAQAAQERAATPVLVNTLSSRSVSVRPVRSVTPVAVQPAAQGPTPYVIAISSTGNAYFFVWNGTTWQATSAPDNAPVIHGSDWTNAEGIPQTPYSDTQAYTPFALPYAVLYDYNEQGGSDFGAPEAGWAPAPYQTEGNGFLVTGDGIIVAI